MPEDASVKRVNFEGCANVLVYQQLPRIERTAPFIIKRYVIGPGGRIAEHRHIWPHQLYFLHGNGMVYEKMLAHSLTHHVAGPGRLIYIPGQCQHHIINHNLFKPLELLSVIPGEYETEEDRIETIEVKK